MPLVWALISLPIMAARTPWSVAGSLPASSAASTAPGTSAGMSRSRVASASLVSFWCSAASGLGTVAPSRSAVAKIWPMKAVVCR